jgi:hypothetical protein
MGLSRDIYDERKAKGLCVQCGKSKNGPLGLDVVVGIRCTKCAGENKARRQQRNEKRRAAGQCTECTNEAMPGRSLCQTCSDKRTEGTRERYYKNKEAGVCRMCGADADGDSLCDKHKQQVKDYKVRKKQQRINP